MSVQIQNIIDGVASGKSLIVEAGAGCGKTTAIVKNISPLLPSNTLFLAFNKSIQTELENRLPGRKVKTFHSLALANLTQRLGKLRVEPNKYKSNALLSSYDYESRSLVSDVISAFQLSDKGACAEFSKQVFLDTLENRLDSLDPTDAMSVETAVSLAFEIFSKEVKKPTALTYDDMLWFLVHFAHTKRWNLKDFACIVVDEAQDVSPIRLNILKRLSDRIIAVGDRRQAIYKFAGALSNAMDEIEDAFNAQCFPLSVTWRCSTAVVDHAALILKESFLQARPDAPEGTVGVVGTLSGAELDSRSMILCRTNKPLVVEAVRLMKNQIPFKMLSDFPEKLLKRTRKFMKDFDGGMASFKRAVFVAYEEKISAIKSANVIARLEDERDTILALSENAKHPDEVLSALEKIVNSNFGVLLTTGHKAKGLEAETVYILSPDLIPAPWISSDDVEDMEQERNLHYVMATRAKTSLYYVGAMPCL